MEECTRQLTRMIDLIPFDFTAVNATLPAYAMIANQQNFTRHDERSTSQPSSRTAKAKSGKFVLLSRAIKHSDIHPEILSLQNQGSRFKVQGSFISHHLHKVHIERKV